MDWKIPLFKIYWDDEDIRVATESIKRGMYWAEGPNITLFEQKLISYLGIPGVLVCNSGTSALHLAVLASGIKHFHEVIVPSFTFIATANAVKFVGAKPVFADIEETTYGLDPEDVERKITPKTKAIIAVHYAGCPCRIQELRQIAISHNLVLIEDAAEALGASDNGLSVGMFGDCSILSFCSNKIISTGEGGALITDNKFIYDRARLLRSHGRDTEHNFTTTDPDAYVALGYNFRMSDMTAGLGVSQLNKIEWIIKKRQWVASEYIKRLSGIEGLTLPLEITGLRHVYQLFTIRTKKRDEVMNHLADNGIMSRVYFNPVHLTDFYRKQSWESVKLPITEQVSKEVLSLPMYPTLTETEIDLVCEKVKEALCTR